MSECEIKWVHVPVFSAHVAFACGDPDAVERAVRREVKRHPREYPGVEFGGLTSVIRRPTRCGELSYSAISMSLKNTVVIWSREPVDLPSVAHECVHAARHVLRWIESDDEEVESYLVEFLLREYLRQPLRPVRRASA